MTHHTVQSCQLRSLPELVCVPCQNGVVVVSARVFKPPSCDFSMSLLSSSCFVRTCPVGFVNLCAGVAAAVPEAKAKIEVDFVGWSCCSSYSNRLLCPRLCNIGIFQVRILPRAFMRGDVALVGLFHKFVSFLHVPSALAPSI